MLYYSTDMLFLFITFSILSAYGQYSVAERAEHLRQWLEANRNSFPQPITDDLISSISGNNDIATTILKIFGFSSEPKVLETQFTKTTNLPSTSRNGIKVADRQVCPFDADPLILSGEYSYCKPTSIGECPAGFVCDFSLVLGRSICCQDMRNQPIINIRIKSQINSTSNPLSTTLSSRREKARIHENTWSSTVPNRRSPWYIRDRATIAPTTLISKNRELATTESAIIEIDSNEVTAKGFISTTSKIASVTDQQGISHQSKSEIGPVSRKLSQTTMPAPFVPSVSTDHLTSVSLIQVGNVERVTDKRMLIVGTIALINDQGYRILVDTGSAADTESLLQGLSKEMISMDEIAVIVITSGHPSHTGNLNLFPLKPTLFHTMEFTEQHATISELKDRPYRKLTENVEVWKTPGPTQQSLSVLVYNVEGYGTMAIVGDLIPSEDYVFNRTDSSADFDGSVWDSLIRRQNSNLIICLADWIVPGHGQPFKVLPLYRQRAGCTRLLAQQKKFAKM